MSSSPIHPDAERVSLYPATSAHRGTVIYLHGGGLIFGSRHDLPDPYITAFTRAGFAIAALDYPFAPQQQIEDILANLEETISSLRQDGALGDRGLTLFGRSAGAFLALNLQARAVMRGDHLADRIISLYGYADMQGKEFHHPSPYYRSFGYVDPLPENPALNDFAARYSLYVGLRQRGSWPEFVRGTGATSISDEILHRMPPAYVAASIADPDVPFRCSKRLASTIPNSHFRRIYDTNEHDFDRDPTSPHGLPMYDEIIAWLLTP